MKKVISILIIIVAALAIIAVCLKTLGSSALYSFRGGNDLWFAEYTVSKMDDYHEEKCVVTYKKDISDLAAVRHIEISYEAGSGSGKLTEDYDEAMTKDTFTLSGGGNGRCVSKDEVIKVTINLDGALQTIELNTNLK